MKYTTIGKTDIPNTHYVILDQDETVLYSDLGKLGGYIATRNIYNVLFLESRDKFVATFLVNIDIDDLRFFLVSTTNINIGFRET